MPKLKAALIFITIQLFYSWLFGMLLIDELGSPRGSIATYIEDNGTSLFGSYYTYNDHVYYKEHLVAEADSQSLRALDSPPYGNIAIDNQAVFCGNSLLPHLDPKTVKLVGENYYADNQRTYHCPQHPQRLDTISWWEDQWHELKFQILGTLPPKRYQYPYVELPANDKDYALLQQFNNLTETRHAIYDADGTYMYTSGGPIRSDEYPIVSNGEIVLYESNIMDNANPSTLLPIELRVGNGDIGYSRKYFGDGENLYYKSRLISTQSSEKPFSFKLKKLTGYEFLINPESGWIHVENYTFDPQYAPYTLLTAHSGYVPGNLLVDGHIDHPLFLSDAGIFYFNDATGKAEKMGENPFVNTDYTEIAPLVFTTKDTTYYVETLGYKETHLKKMLNPPNGNWDLLGSIMRGTIWKKGNSFYYIDQYGASSGIKHTIYKIDTAKTANTMLTNDPDYWHIGTLIDDHKLTPVENESIAQTKNNDEGFVFGFDLTTILLLLVTGMIIYAVYLIISALRKIKRMNQEIEQFEKERNQKFRF